MRMTLRRLNSAKKLMSRDRCAERSFQLVVRHAHRVQE
jgi:hypothetical protein